ncbi:MAG: NAD(P)-binding domain-containing protein [Candidatus Zixiibacteriota bacterium]
MSKKIGILGSGMVGQSLANGFVRHGHDVMIGTGSRNKYDDLKKATNGKAAVGTFAETARFGETVVLAVKGAAAEATVKSVGIENLRGKTVIDATNPIDSVTPVNGVLQYFTPMNDSLMERLQKAAPEARFVKAFSCVGSPLMVNPDFGGLKPTMFICGNDTGAKQEVTNILGTFGWEIEDMGRVEAARAIEPLAILWCIPGLSHNRWTHAFKLLKK